MLVETALVLPLVFALLLGISTAGIAVYHRNSVNNAAREAARFGATVPADQCDIAASCSGLSWANLVRSVAVTRSDGLLASSEVCVALVSGSGSAPVAVDANHTTAGGSAPCYADQSVDTGQRVQVTATRSDNVQFIFFDSNVQGTAKATARFG